MLALLQCLGGGAQRCCSALCVVVRVRAGAGGGTLGRCTLVL